MTVWVSIRVKKGGQKQFLAAAQGTVHLCSHASGQTPPPSVLTQKAENWAVTLPQTVTVARDSNDCVLIRSEYARGSKSLGALVRHRRPPGRLPAERQGSLGLEDSHTPSYAKNAGPQLVLSWTFPKDVFAVSSPGEGNITTG